MEFPRFSVPTLHSSRRRPRIEAFAAPTLHLHFGLKMRKARGRIAGPMPPATRILWFSAPILHASLPPATMRYFPRFSAPALHRCEHEAASLVPVGIAGPGSH